MEEILAKLDLSDEIKQTLQEAFDKAILVKSSELASKKIDEINESAGEYEAKVQEGIQEGIAELEDTLDSYLDTVVSKIIEESTFAINEDVNSAKLNALLSGFDSMLVTAGIDTKVIDEGFEAKDVNESEVEDNSELIEDLNGTINDLMSEKQELIALNSEYLKTGLIKETMEDMTELEKSKFLKLAGVIDFDIDSAAEYGNKLDTLAESVKGAVETSTVYKNEDGETEAVDTEVDTITESLKEMNESSTVKTTEYVSAASHLFR